MRSGFFTAAAAAILLTAAPASSATVFPTHLTFESGAGGMIEAFGRSVWFESGWIVVHLKPLAGYVDAEVVDGAFVVAPGNFLHASFSGPNGNWLINSFDVDADADVDYRVIGSPTYSVEGGTGGFITILPENAVGSHNTSLLMQSAGTFRVDNIRATVSVPEPATWALMIGGFGLAGATLRRRRLALA